MGFRDCNGEYTIISRQGQFILFYFLMIDQKQDSTIPSQFPSCYINEVISRSSVRTALLFTMASLDEFTVKSRYGLRHLQPLLSGYVQLNKHI